MNESNRTQVGQAHNAWFYATKPTKSTLFFRTFLPWQMWKFLLINLKMVGMIRASHKGERH